MSARTRVKVFTWLMVIVAVVCVICAGFFIWKMVEGIESKDTWGITANIIMTVILLFVAALGIAGSVNKSTNCLNSFILSSVIIIIMCTAELVITAIGVTKCDTLPSGSTSDNGIWDFICSSSSWVLLIPMGIILLALICGLIFDILLKKALDDDDRGGDTNLSYYPS